MKHQRIKNRNLPLLALHSFFLLFFIFFATVSQGVQAEEECLIDEVLLTVSKVEMFKEKQNIGSASGFFFRLADDYYFVTNTHVVVPPVGPEPDSIHLLLHTGLFDISPKSELVLPLYEHGKRRWKSHPTQRVDVVLIPLDAREMASYRVHWLQPSDFVTEQFNVYPGEGVLVMGYPLGYSDVEHNLPILRHATLASAYGVNFKNEPMCLIDGSIQHGMSGSPILTVPASTRTDKNGHTRFAKNGIPYMLVGILSQIEPADEKIAEFTIKTDIGLCNCWYPKLLLEIAQGNN